MTIQLQVLSVHALTSQSYMLQCINKKYPSTCCPQQRTRTPQIVVTDIREKPVDFFMVSNGRLL